jgi:hypothetical protein
MNRASLFLRGDAMFLHADSETTAGVWIATEPFLRLEASISDIELGKAIQRALQGSKRQVPHPQFRAGMSLVAPLLKLAGVKTWRAFERGAKCVSIQAELSEIAIVPEIRVGDNRGFQPLVAETITVGASEDAALGAAVRTALHGE